jgi:transposase-like protein
MAIRALRASGGTVAAFAREHGLHMERLRRWRKRVGKDAVAAVTAELVPVDVITGGAGTKFEVVIGGIVVRVPATFDETALRRLLGVVAAC